MFWADYPLRVLLRLQHFRVGGSVRVGSRRVINCVALPWCGLAGEVDVGAVERTGNG